MRAKHMLAAHLFVLLSENVDFNLLRFDLLYQPQVFSSTCVYGVQDQHCEDYAHVEWDEYHGQEQQAAVEDGGCCAQLAGCWPAARMETHLRAERRDGRIPPRLRSYPRVRSEATKSVAGSGGWLQELGLENLQAHGPSQGSDRQQPLRKIHAAKGRPAPKAYEDKHCWDEAWTTKPTPF